MLETLYMYRSEVVRSNGKRWYLGKKKTDWAARAASLETVKFLLAKHKLDAKLLDTFKPVKTEVIHV